MMRWRDQRGVAMVTVLFVGAALTATASAATFVTIQEFRAGTDDRRAADALAVAEAGIDRFLNEIRTNRWTWGDIRQAGCVTTENPSGAPLTLSGDLGSSRTFTVNFTVFPVADCPNRTANPRIPVLFAAQSTGMRPAARRVIRQTIRIEPLNLPVGIYANIAGAAGNTTMNGISLIVDGTVTGREFLAFKGADPYYFLSDFWPGLSSTTHIPAAVHATGHVYLKNQANENAQEHRPGNPLNCDANKTNKGGTAGQSSWDQSGDGAAIVPPASCANWLGTPTGPPSTSLFTPTDLTRVTPKPELSDQDYITLRDAAKRSGLYCFFPTSGAAQCLRNGAAWSFGGTVTQADIDAVTQADFVAYFEYEDTSKAGCELPCVANEVKWDASVNGCNPDPGRSVVLIVRQGNLQVQANRYINGAILVPEGTFRTAGNVTVNGTIIADEFDVRGGASFTLNDCWVANMPGPFLSALSVKWSEIDR